MQFIVQSPSAPERILSALGDLTDDNLLELRFAVAYVTASGVEVLLDRIARKLGEQRWAAARKSLVTCTDHGITEPSALRRWLGLPRSSVMLRNAHLIDAGGLDPTSAFHAKVYEFRNAARSNLLVGSANLSERALTSNTEAATAHTDIGDLANLDAAWTAFCAGAVIVDAALVDAYEAVRLGAAPQPPPPIAPPMGAPAQPLWEAVNAGICTPSNFEYFWVEGGNLSGGSHNQLELPRGANRFFGFAFANYNNAQIPIGPVNLAIHAEFHTNRPLSWHGDNRMERLNLPTGQVYDGNVMLFRRRADRFDLIWTAAGRNRANAWAVASENAGRRYKLGQNSPRVCGFF